MRRFLVKSLLFALLVLGPIFAVLFLPLPHSHLLSPILNKIDSLKTDERRDRIFFVGGSGLYLGLDGELVQEQLHRPVMNLGVAAAFATTPLLHEIQPYLRAGDAVVVIPEYGVAFDRYAESARPFLLALRPFRNFLPLYRVEKSPIRAVLSDIYTLDRSKLKAVPTAFRDALHRVSLAPFVEGGYVDYGRYCNGTGDCTRFVRPAPSAELIAQRGESYFADPGEDYLNQSFAAFNAFCLNSRQRGIAVYFIFPAYPEQEYLRQESGMRKYERRLRQELACPILGSPDDFLYPYELFTDTVFHLNAKGKGLRTERVVGLLREALPADQPYSASASAGPEHRP